MFKKYVKPILLFSRSQNKAPNFVLVYLLIWLVWHSQFFITFVNTTGNFTSRLNSAISSNDHQYIAVLFLTLLFFTFRLTYLYFVNKADAIIEEEEPIENKVGSDQLFSENKDVIRLLSLLEETKEKLKQSRESENQLRKEKEETESNLRSVQIELDEVKADLTILVKTNEDLTAKIKNDNIMIT